jgi:hypothetical protein
MGKAAETSIVLKYSIIWCASFVAFKLQGGGILKKAYVVFAALATVAIMLSVVGVLIFYSRFHKYSEGFENGFGEWSADADVTEDPNNPGQPVEWHIDRVANVRKSRFPFGFTTSKRVSTPEPLYALISALKTPKLKRTFMFSGLPTRLQDGKTMHTQRLSMQFPVENFGLLLEFRCAGKPT